MKTQLLYNKILSIIILLSLFSFSSYAQGNFQKKKEMIESQKIAYITQYMQLTPAESQKFWPLYNEFIEKRDILAQEFKKKNINARLNSESFSDKEAEDFINYSFVQAQKILDLKKEYNEKFKAVIPVKKLIKYYEAEKGFKKYLLKQIKEKRRANKFDE